PLSLHDALPICSQLLSLSNQLSSVAVRPPRRDLLRQSPVLFRRGAGRLPFVLRNVFVVGLHRGLASRQFLLNPDPLIAALTRKIHDGIIKLILVETELGLCNLKVAAFQRVRRRSRTSRQSSDSSL